MAVSFGKPDPYAPFRDGMDNEAWNSTVRLPRYLETVYPPYASRSIYRGLTRNHLGSLAVLITYENRYDNTTGKLAERS